jgi:hypothetical protein
MRSENFMQNGIIYTGNKSFAHPNLSYRTRQRLIAENNLKASAKGRGAMKTLVENTLRNNINILASYVQSHGETPNQDTNKLILQAALIRLNDVQLIARAMDTTDDNATLVQEDEDSEACDLNLPTSEYLPTPEVFAALKYVQDQLKSKSGTDSVGLISQLSNNFDNFQPSFGDVVDSIEDFGFNNEYYKDRDNGLKPYNSWDSSLTNASNPNAVDNFDSATTETTTPVQSKSIWDLLSGVVNQVAQPAATQYAIQKDFPMVLTIILVIGLIVIGSIYAAKN